MMMATQTFGQRVESARIAAGLTKSDLGRLVSVSPTCVWNWEKKNRTPDKQTVVKLPSALGVSLEYLLTGKEKKADDVPTTIDEVLRLAERYIATIIGMPVSSVKASVQIV